MAQPSSEKTPSVYLYIPNIIGYFRIIINFIAFAGSSTFGAVLDMGYHCLFIGTSLPTLQTWLSFFDAAWVGYYKPLVSNLVPLCSFLHLVGKTSHKDVKDTGNWLLKLYYGHRPFMAFCCVASEVLYIILFLFADEKSTSLLNVCRCFLKGSPLTFFVFISTLVGWALKQVINIIQVSRNQH
uniref:CDP-diacylglycerol--inositol 3-phosphatidyltransferase n=1 Tax=Oryza barthii TaxID=65489 RepID=A0A0D3GGX2_9ORYZ